MLSHIISALSQCFQLYFSIHLFMQIGQRNLIVTFPSKSFILILLQPTIIMIKVGASAVYHVLWGEQVKPCFLYGQNCILACILFSIQPLHHKWIKGSLEWPITLHDEGFQRIFVAPQRRQRLSPPVQQSEPICLDLERKSNTTTHAMPFHFPVFCVQGASCVPGLSLDLYNYHKTCSLFV